jgi:uncharacterized protein (DUF4415 family)
MPTVKKPMTSSKPFSAAAIASAKAAAVEYAHGNASRLNWSHGVVTPGGGVTATIAVLGRTRGPNKKPAKVQVAIRLDPDLVGALRASGPGWQTRVNAALKQWLASQPEKRKPRRHGAV